MNQVTIAFFEMYLFAKRTGCEATRKNLKAIVPNPEVYFRNLPKKYFQYQGRVPLLIGIKEMIKQDLEGMIPAGDANLARLNRECYLKRLPTSGAFSMVLEWAGREFHDFPFADPDPSGMALASCGWHVRGLAYELGECLKKEGPKPSIQSVVLFFKLLTGQHFYRVLNVDWTNLDTSLVQVKSNVKLCETLEDALDKANLLLAETPGLLGATVHEIEMKCVAAYLREIMPVARSLTLMFELFTYCEEYRQTKLDFIGLFDPFYERG